MTGPMSARFPYPAAYIMAGRPFGVIYLGCTNDLPRRAWEHRDDVVPGFIKRYGCNLLVSYEPHELMTEAIRRERLLKHWNRAWKLQLIEQTNPDWKDLYPTLNL